MTLMRGQRAAVLQTAGGVAGRPLHRVDTCSEHDGKPRIWAWHRRPPAGDSTRSRRQRPDNDRRSSTPCSLRRARRIPRVPPPQRPRSMPAEQDTQTRDDGTPFLLPWKAFCDDDIFANVDSIHSFRIRVFFPQFIAWSGRDKMVPYQDALYESMYEVLEQSRLFHFDRLQRNQTANSVGVSYTDADAEFSVDFDQDATLQLTRPGSSLEQFYSWYGRVMPHLVRIVDGVRDQLGRQSGGADGPRNIQPSRAMYTFGFILHGFASGPASRPRRVKNAHVLRRALTHVPGADGELVELSDAELPELGRIDLAISRRHQSPSGMIREIYRLEAPGNRDYGTLWLQLSYIAETRDETYDVEDVEDVKQPDFAIFLRRFDYPLLEFVRERALCHFLSGITQGLTFKAVPGRLP